MVFGVCANLSPLAYFSYSHVETDNIPSFDYFHTYSLPLLVSAFKQECREWALVSLGFISLDVLRMFGGCCFKLASLWCIQAHPGPK